MKRFRIVLCFWSVVLGVTATVQAEQEPKKHKPNLCNLTNELQSYPLPSRRVSEPLPLSNLQKMFFDNLSCQEETLDQTERATVRRVPLGLCLFSSPSTCYTELAMTLISDAQGQPERATLVAFSQQDTKSLVGRFLGFGSPYKEGNIISSTATDSSLFWWYPSLERDLYTKAGLLKLDEDGRYVEISKEEAIANGTFNEDEYKNLVNRVNNSMGFMSLCSDDYQHMDVQKEQHKKEIARAVQFIQSRGATACVDESLKDYLVFKDANLPQCKIPYAKGVATKFIVDVL